jgi:hypothetical protein
MKFGTQIRFLRALGAGVAAAGLVAPTLAQSAAGDFEKPLPAKAAQPAKPGQGGRSATTMRQVDGNTSFEIRIVDGKITAKANGKEVPADRIVREEDGIKLLDEDGNVVQRFQVQVGEKHTVIGGAPRAPKAPDDGDLAMTQKRPKVMLGINMAVPSEALNKNYDLEEGTAILIDKVLDGLSADRAGIRENDVVTEIDGKKPATPETLWEALKDKEPGDTVTFTVLRKGGNRAIRVKLDAFDADKLAPLMGTPKAGGDMWTAPPEAQEEARKLLGRRLGGDEWRKLYNGEGEVRVLPPGDMDMFINPRTGQMADMDRRMAELDEKLSRLSEQMAKIEAMMDKLAKQKD